MENTQKQLTWENLQKQYSIEGTRMTDDNIQEAVRDEVKMFELKLWGLWKLMEENNDYNTDRAGEIVNDFYNLSSAVGKLSEFTDLFMKLLLDDPRAKEDIKQEDYRYINIEQLLGGEK